MLRTWIGLTLLTALALPTATYGAEPLEHHFGTEYAALVSVSSVAAFKRALENTAIWAMMHDEAAWKEGEPPAYEQQIRKTLGMPLEDLLERPPLQAVLGLMPAEPGGLSPGPRLAFLVRLGQDQERARRVFQHLANPQSGLKRTYGALLDDTPCLILDEKVVVAIKGNLFGVASSKEALAGLLRGPRPAGKRLVDTERFKATMAPLGKQSAGQIYAYFDVSVLASGRAGAAEAVGVTARPVGKRIRWEAHFYAPGASEALSAALGRNARALLRGVPPDAVGAVALRCDPSKLVLQQLAVPEQVAPFLGPVAAARKVDADQIRQVLEALNGDVVAYLPPPEDRPGAPLPRVVVELGVGDRDRLAEGLDNLGKHLAETFKGGLLRYRREGSGEADAGGRVWHVIEFEAPFLPGRGEVTAVLGEKRLVIGTRRDDVTAALQRGGRTLGRSFLDRPGVSRALDGVGGDGAVVAYVDGKDLAAWVRAIEKRDDRRERGDDRRERRDDRRERGDDRHERRTEDHPQVTDQDEQKRRASLANLQKILVAMQKYAGRHDRRMPTSLDDLVKANLLDEKALTCPTSGRRYHYINRGLPEDELDQQAVLAYEVTPGPDGTHAFAALRGVYTASPEDFARYTADIPAHLLAPRTGPGPAVTPRPGGPQQGLTPGLPGLPNPEVLFKHLTPHASCLAVRRTGLFYAGEEFALPVGLIATGLLAVGAAPAATPATPVTPVTPVDKTSEERLLTIGAAIRTFAGSHNGRLPAALDELARALLLDAKALTLPGTARAYAYVHYDKKTVTQLTVDDLLVYEPTARASGARTVLFGGGRVASLGKEAFEKALARASGRPVTPDPQPEPTPTVTRPEPPKVPLEKQLSSWLTLAKALLDRRRYERCEFYCRKVLEKARKGSLIEFRAKRMLERCAREKRPVDSTE